MKKINKKYYIGLIIVLAAVVLGGVLIQTQLNTKITENTKYTSPQPSPGEERGRSGNSAPSTSQGKAGDEVLNSVSVTIGNSTLNLPLTYGASFYDDLVLAQKAGKITFSGKNYPGLGFFITDIGDLHSGSGKNLIYYINGVEASVGISSYIPKAGDVVLWKLE